MAETKLEADWLHREDLAMLVDALGAEDMRWVGGSVRDTLLGIEVADIDAATMHEPQEVIRRLKEAGIRSVPTGIDHGTVTALMPGGPVEITTLRKDVSTDGRRATVAFASNWRDDAARRDFTINALYAHPVTGLVTDYFGGLEDLAARRVRFIGNAHERIREDHLRILRYFRFQARFGSQLDETAEQACSELAETLKGLSRERVAKELLLLLGLPDPHPTVSRMRALGVMQVVIPESGAHELDVLERLIAREKAERVKPDGLRRLAAMVPTVPPVAETIASRLRLSRAQRERLVSVSKRMADDAENARALAYRKGMEIAVDRVLLAGGSIAKLRGWEVPVFPLKGGEIVQRGVGAGPEVARILQGIQNIWVAEGFPERARVLALLDAELERREQAG